MTTLQLFRHLGARAAKPEIDSKRERETVKTVPSPLQSGHTGLRPGGNETVKLGAKETVKRSSQGRPFNWADESPFHQYGVSTK